MAFNLYLTAGTAPFGAALPGNAQALLNFVSAYVLITGSGDIGGINYGSNEPSPENRSYPWWKTNPDGNPIGMYNWNGSAWVTVSTVVQNGPTSSRPVDAAAYTQYFDTTIGVMIIWTGARWITLSGSPGDLKFVTAATIDSALVLNPGWIQFDTANGCVLGGAGANAARGLTTRVAGAFVGAETHEITVAEMPLHSHTTTANWGEGGEGGGDNPLYYDNAQAPGLPQPQPDTGPAGSGTAMSLMGPTLFQFLLVKQA